jgi:hypothetical protein
MRVHYFIVEHNTWVVLYREILVLQFFWGHLSFLYYIKVLVRVFMIIRWCLLSGVA